MAGVAIAAISTATVAIAAIPVAAVPIAAVAIAAISAAAVAIAAIPVAAVPITAVPMATVPITAVPMAAVLIATVAKSGATISCIHNFKNFLPTDFTNNFKVICNAFIATLNHSIGVGNHFRNLVFRIKTVIIKAVSQPLAEVHPAITNRRYNIFFKYARASVLFISASPI
jgi:hypothetical protein